jgi:photosynthetic reaction center cytochrome c subunit
MKTALSVLIFVLALTAVAAQTPQAPALQPAVPTAAQQYKNIQVLKDLPADQLNQTMHLIEGSLGVECQFCHIWGEWDKDVKPMKSVARRMFAMMEGINKNLFAGAQKVTCYTCHRGSPDPVSMVVLPVPLPPSVDNPPPAPVLPTVDQILTKYIDALGGEQALRKVTTRVIMGTRDIPTGSGGMVPMPSEVEMYQKAPNLTLNVYKTATFVASDGFDGIYAWTKNMAGRVATLQDSDSERVRRAANLYQPIDLKNEYARMTVTAIEKINGRDAYVVAATPPNDLVERLYFDVQSGLLLRKASMVVSGVGMSPFEVNYEDYRTTKSGVKFPYLTRMYPAGPRTVVPSSSTLRVTVVQEGVAIDDKKFARPAP